MIKNPSNNDCLKSPLSLTITHTYTGMDTSSINNSPHAYFDEDNRKVVIITAAPHKLNDENDRGSGNKQSQKKV
jgi:hypothetical protein